MKFAKYIIVCCVCAFLSCQEKDGKELEQGWSLALVDSISVDHLGEMMLLDMSPNGKLFLMADYQQNRYFLTDQGGTILHTYDKSGDQPESFGFAYSEMAFSGDTAVFVIGSKGLKWYNFEGEEIKFTAFNPSYQLRGIMRNTGGGPVYFPTPEGEKILYRGGAELGKRSDAGYYEKVRGATLIDPESFELNHLFPLEKDSRFFDGKHYDDGDLYTRIAVGKDYIYVTYDANPVLYGYAKSFPYELKFKRALKLKDIVLSDGMPAEFIDYDVYVDASKGGLRNIQTDSEYIYLMYFEGVTKERLAELDAIYEQDEKKGDAEYDLELASRAKRLKVFDLEGQELTDVLLPSYLDSYWGFLVRDGSLYFNKATNREVEEDFYTFYQLKLVK